VYTIMLGTTVVEVCICLVFITSALANQECEPKFHANAEGLPFSDAVQMGDTLYVSGQIGISEGSLADGFVNQFKVAMGNLKTVLESHGSSLKDVVKMNIWLADMSDYEELNTHYKTFFEGDFPARAAMQVGALPLEALVEVEAIGLVRRTNENY